MKKRFLAIDGRPLAQPVKHLGAYGPDTEALLSPVAVLAVDYSELEHRILRNMLAERDDSLVTGRALSGLVAGDVEEVVRCARIEKLGDAPMRESDQDANTRARLRRMCRDNPDSENRELAAVLTALDALGGAGAVIRGTPATGRERCARCGRTPTRPVKIAFKASLGRPAVTKRLCEGCEAKNAEVCR